MVEKCKYQMPAYRLNCLNRAQGKTMLESQCNMQAILEGVQEPICIFLLDGSITWANASFRQNFTTNHDESSMANFFQLMEEEDRWTLQNDIVSLTVDTPVRLLKYRTKTFQDKAYIQQWRIQALFDTGNTVVSYKAIAIDGIDQELDGEQPLSGENQFEYLIENAQEAIIVVQNGRLMFVNRKMEVISGYQSEELLFHDFVNFIHPNDRALLVDRHEKRLQDIDIPSITYDFRLIHKSGREIWVELSATRVCWQGMAATLNFLRDITERKQAEAVMQETEKRFRTLFEQAPIGIAQVTPDGKPMHANRAMQELLGYSEEEMRNRTIADWTHPDDVGASFRLIEFLRAGNADRLSMEKRYLHKDGTLIWARTAVAAVRDKGGNLEYLIAMIEDVSEEKRAERELYESESRYRNLFMHSPDAIFVNVRDRVTLANEACLQLFGAKRSRDILGKSVYDLFPAEIHPLIQGRIHRMRDLSQAVPNLEAKILRLDGSSIDVEIVAAPFSAGDATAIHVILRDITERKQAELDLAASERKYRTVIEKAAEGILMAEVESRQLLYANQAMCSMLGYTAEELCRLRVDDIHPKDSLEEVLALFAIQASGKESRGAPIPVLCKDRSVLILDVNATPMEVDGKRCIVGLFTNVTAEIRLQEEKKVLAEQLQQAQKMESVGRLAGGVAHDLNNLLTPILGFGELLLEDTPVSDTRHNDIEEIVNAGLRARDLINQLLAFSRKQALRMQQINLNELLQRFEKLLRRTIRENIDIRLYLADSLPIVKGDVGQIEQIIMNLAVNAQDAMPNGGLITIETSSLDLDEEYANLHPGTVPGHHVMLCLSDTGFGMDEDTSSKVFEPFYTTKELDEGTGLGLSTVYGIIKQHKGNIWVYSEPGRGTTFRLYLPVSEETESHRTEFPVNNLSTKGSETILLVEDNSMVRKLIISLLKRKGYTILAVESGQAACALLQEYKEPIQLLLTDIVLPGMDGKQVYEQAIRLHPEIRVLYMSGYTDKVVSHHGILAEEAAFIQKPFFSQNLERKVREVLDKEGGC